METSSPRNLAALRIFFSPKPSHAARRRVMLAVCAVALFGLMSSRCAVLSGQDSLERGRQTPTPTVVVDGRVELFSVIFRMAGNPEYGQGKVDDYVTATDEYFTEFKEHRVIQLARRLRAEHGVSFDAVMGMALHLKDARTLQERVPLDPRPETLDSRWQPDDAREFLEAAREFVVDTSFEKFLDEHRELYQRAEQRMTMLLEKEAHFEWFDRFFGTQQQGSYTVVIGLLNGGNNYGVRVPRVDGNLDLYGVIGVWSTDREGMPVFDKVVLGTIVHEFCHSYANPLVDRFADQLQPSAEAMFPFVEQAMARQAYGNWRTMMYESLVRASTIRYLSAHEGRLAAWTQTRDDRQRQFLWIADLARLLGEYEEQRDLYPTLEDFMPRVVEFYRDYAKAFVAEQKQVDAIRPKVVAISPAQNENGVPPEAKSITIEFDRPMRDQSWSLVGGGDHFPELIGKPSYDQARKVWSVGVRLKPNWDYEFGINSATHQGFQSQDGVPVQPMVVKFRTGQ